MTKGEADAGVAKVECAKCGQTNLPEVRVCAACGESLYLHCHRCHARNLRNATRCSKCGRHVRQSAWGRFKRLIGRQKRRDTKFKILFIVLVFAALYYFIRHSAGSGGFPNLPQGE